MPRQQRNAGAVRPPSRASVSAELRRLARPAGSFNAASYFRGDHGLRFHNVGTPRVRALVRGIRAATRDAWTVADATRFADALLRDPYLETKAVGVEVLAGYRKTFTPALLPQCRKWLAGNLAANWATTDLLCGMVLGPLLADREELLPRMRAWARDPNMWVRRASAVALLPSIRRGRAVDLGYEIAAQLHADREDLIQKAVGWLLRELGKRDPARLERYLRAEGPRIPRTTVRYAIERFSAATRAALLAATRPAQAPNATAARPVPRRPAAPRSSRRSRRRAAR